MWKFLTLLVGGLTGEAVDEEVFDYLKQYGPIERVIKVTSSEPHFKDTAIVDTLPYRRPTTNPNITNQLQHLSDLYAADKGSTLTHTCLAELQDVAKLRQLNQLCLNLIMDLNRQMIQLQQR